MSLIAIDEQKCQRDGHCVAVCPTKVLALKKGAFPAATALAEEMCIRCGHCVAVCPHGALSHREMASADCPAGRPDWKLSPEQVEHFLRSRRSIRAYQDKTVEREAIAKLISIARYAPSGHNGQPVEWLVVSGRAEVKKLGGLVVEWM